LRDLHGQDLDLLVVCSPCQPFSAQNRQRRIDDRSRLILEAGRFTRVLRPKLIFFENVPGLASNRHAELLNELRETLGGDYTLRDPERVDAADFGVPQRRVRCIMLAARKVEPPELPVPITPRGSRVTVQSAIGHLARLASGEADAADPLHFARNHQGIALRRLAAVPKDGGSRSALPSELELACHANVGQRKFSDVYGRMAWHDVAPTLRSAVCGRIVPAMMRHRTGLTPSSPSPAAATRPRQSGPASTGRSIIASAAGAFRDGRVIARRFCQSRQQTGRE
jgi:DNA (cytosine-5)-methyltransferase 1